MSELWRPVPANPEYEISNRGRLRGPGGVLCMPDISGRSVAAARYAVPLGRDRRVYLLVREAMREIWRVEFVPTATWVRKVRAEVLAAFEARRAAKRAASAKSSARRKAPTVHAAAAPVVEDPKAEDLAPVADDPKAEDLAPVAEDPKVESATSPRKSPSSKRSKPSRPPVDGMPCPWATEGKLDRAGLPEGITTWDCAEMDPMTNRQPNGVWVDIPLPRRGRNPKSSRRAA